MTEEETLEPPSPGTSAAERILTSPPATAPKKRRKRSADPTPLPSVVIPDKLFFSIGEVSELTGVPAYVLRYWESQFKIVAPEKNAAGQRTYRRREVEMILSIRKLLYEEQYTIAGARRRLREALREHEQSERRAQARAEKLERLSRIRSALVELSQRLSRPLSEA